MFCAKCGTELSADTKFCTKCGAEINSQPEKKDEPAKKEVKEEVKQEKIKISVPEPKPTPQASPLPPPTEGGGFWRTCLFIILGLIVVLLIGIFGFIWYLKNLILDNIPVADLQKYLADEQLSEDEIKDLVSTFADNMDIEVDDAFLDEIAEGIISDLTTEDLKGLKEMIDAKEEAE